MTDQPTCTSCGAIYHPDEAVAPYQRHCQDCGRQLTRDAQARYEDQHPNRSPKPTARWSTEDAAQEIEHSEV